MDPFDDRLVAVDTFTGIGGITLALEPFVCSALYCEWSAYQQSVLISRMKDNKIDRAPIHHDIRTLKLSRSMKPTMIFGGPPCQDLSTIGLQRGIVAGPQSSMFFEVVRLIDENPSIEIVFLENVANILNLGLKDVIEALTKHDFTVQWTVRTASELGAPHQRKRWFLLALRGDGLAKLAHIVDRFLAKSTCGGLDGLRLWEGNEPPARISFKPSVREDPTYDDDWVNRSQTMGNAVVPVVVRKAFIDLVQGAKEWSSYIDDNSALAKECDYPFPHEGIVTPDRKLFVLPKRVVVPVRHNVQIVAPGSMKKGKKDAEKEADEEETEELLHGRPAVKLSGYPTPRKGLSHASTLTERSIRDLPTVLTYCKQTKEYLDSLDFVLPEGKALHQVTIPSPEYLAFMMGYPLDWTMINRDDESLPAPLTRAAIARTKTSNTEQQQPGQSEVRQGSD